MVELLTTTRRPRRRGAWTRALPCVAAQPGFAPLFPAPRDRWVDDLALEREELAAITRARPAHPRRGRPPRAARRRRPRAARARCPTRGAPVRPLRPRAPRSNAPRSSTESSTTSWRPPMPEFAVLRSPDAVLFGPAWPPPPARVAARHGRRVFVVTDPVLADDAGLRRRGRSLRGRLDAPSSPTPRSTSAIGGRRRGAPAAPWRAGRRRRRRRRQRDRPRQGDRAAAGARRRAGGLLRACSPCPARSSR